MTKTIMVFLDTKTGKISVDMGTFTFRDAVAILRSVADSIENDFLEREAIRKVLT